MLFINWYTWLFISYLYIVLIHSVNSIIYMLSYPLESMTWADELQFTMAVYSLAPKVGSPCNQSSLGDLKCLILAGHALTTPVLSQLWGGRGGRNNETKKNNPLNTY